ncbi:type I-MYXAN CRISPR-associated protein Cas6/Cmx6 [soil metagenome]
MNMIIDLDFRITGDSVPSDHGYLLYSSLSRLRQSLHAAEWLGIHPISGIPAGDGSLKLSPSSRLRFRLPIEYLPELIPLAGKRLVLALNDRISAVRIGLPEIQPLKPGAELFSRCVTIKLSATEKGDRAPDRELFLAAVHAKLQRLGIAGKVSIDDELDSRGHERSRRVIHIKQKTVVGYSVHITELSEKDSLQLQEVGIGGRRRMGCGVFVPVKTKHGDREQES